MNAGKTWRIIVAEQCDEPKSRNRAALKWTINSRDSVIAVVMRPRHQANYLNDHY